MGDTFGFSVLEMQACGCPVITTDRQALPEINNDQCGWVIDTKDIPLLHGDDFAYYTRDEVETLSKTVEEKLIEIVNEILERRQLICLKAVKSLERIANGHSSGEYAERLRSIYQRAN